MNFTAHAFTAGGAKVCLEIDANPFEPLGLSVETKGTYLDMRVHAPAIKKSYMLFNLADEDGFLEIRPTPHEARRICVYSLYAAELVFQIDVSQEIFNELRDFFESED